MSQDYTIDYYLARAQKVPDYIFIELGPEYYSDPGVLGASYLTTGTAISEHTADQLGWRARSMLTVYPSTPRDELSNFWHLSTHFLFNVLDFGLGGQLVADRDLPVIPGFTPVDVTPKPLLPSEVSTIATSARALATGSVSAQIAFLLDYRRMQLKKLTARGAKVVGFYQTTMLPQGMRVYGIQVCRALSSVPCITGDDPTIRRRLNDASLWFDPAHMTHRGAEVYSAWFAARMGLLLASHQEREK
jgi:hypothetical protein